MKAAAAVFVAFLALGFSEAEAQYLRLGADKQEENRQPRAGERVIVSPLPVCDSGWGTGTPGHKVKGCYGPNTAYIVDENNVIVAVFVCGNKPTDRHVITGKVVVVPPEFTLVAGPQGPEGPQGPPGANGRFMVSGIVNSAGHLIIGMSDGTNIDAGKVTGNDGKDFRPTGNGVICFRGTRSTLTCAGVAALIAGAIWGGHELLEDNGKGPGGHTGPAFNRGFHIPTGLLGGR